MLCSSEISMRFATVTQPSGSSAAVSASEPLRSKSQESIALIQPTYTAAKPPRALRT
ncbi:unannotated protein [freshwater metagenome]|uniref:Unannotated protein n=1 Tax=freshwater metagenome TaxID=449393 RepID=A0A6J7EIG5_9ZZZZ